MRLLPPARAEEGAAEEGPRNHRRRKVVPDAAAVAAGPAKLRSKGRGGGRECSPPGTLLLSMSEIHLSTRRSFRTGGEAKVKYAGFHPGSDNKLLVKHRISRAMFFGTQRARPMSRILSE